MHFGDISHNKLTSKQIVVENNSPFMTTFVIERLSTAIKRYIVTGELSQFSEEYIEKTNNLKMDMNKLVQLGYIQD